MVARKNSLYWCRRYGYEAMISQNFIAAGRWCVKTLIEHGFQSGDCANLAFIAFDRCSRPTQAMFYDRLVEAGFDDVEVPAATFLRLSFEIALAGGEADKRVRVDYIDGILGRHIKTMPSKPILFWHVPKCSGTSLNEALSSHFYGTRLADVWPGYNYRPLVAYLLENFLAEIPYASSVHLGMDDLSPDAEHFAFTVLRDPVQRCFSMFRQEMSVNVALTENEQNWHHYRAFARYGDFWNFRNDRDFFCWLDNIPPQLLSRQLSTFSQKGSVSEALERVRGLDYCFFRELGVGSEEQLFQMLGIEYTRDTVPSDRNRSDKAILVPDSAEGLLRPRLTKEYELINALTDQQLEP